LSYSKATGWTYTEPDASRIRKAYDLLFERKSWKAIAAEIGGGFSCHGVSRTLSNPVWKGLRRYTDGRDEPLEVSMPGITEPLISPERWEAAQKLIAAKRDVWKARKKSASFLLSGLLTCGCGKPLYPRLSGSGCFYYCSSAFPGRGPRCAQRSVQKSGVENAVAEIIASQFVNAAFLRAVFERLQNARPAATDDTDKAGCLKAKLEAERRRLLQLVMKGLATEEDLDRENRRIDAELRDLDKLMPAPAPTPAFDPAKLAVQISRTFAGFHRLSFDDRRNTLRDVCRRITVLDDTIPSITLNGAFLNRVNESPRLRTQDWL
jgi:hypothetical protein